MLKKQIIILVDEGYDEIIDKLTKFDIDILDRCYDIISRTYAIKTKMALDQSKNMLDVVNSVNGLMIKGEE